MSSGITVIGAEAPSIYHMAPRTENHNEVAGSAPVGAYPSSVELSGIPGKKRGRPRKYRPDGPAPAALSPSPISSSAPLGEHFSSGKRGRGRPAGWVKKHKEVEEAGNMGEWNEYHIGTNFMPHVIKVNAGEDITMKDISFCQQGPRAICVLSANGAISNATLCQPDSSGGTLTYEGYFEIISLSGSFIPTESQGIRSMTGGLSVSLASPEGRVLGGGVTGLLIAAAPLEVVVGSFILGRHHEQKTKKRKNESTQASNGMNVHGQLNCNTSNSHFASPSSSQQDIWSTMHIIQDSRNSTDISISLSGG